MINLRNKVRLSVKKAYSVLNTIKSFKSNPLADLSFLQEGLAAHTNPIDSQYHEYLVNRILISYQKAKAEQESVPLAYKPGGEWDEDIKTRRANYLKVLRNNDIPSLSELLKNFFRNSGMAGLSAYGYYQDIVNGSTYKKKWFVTRILQDLATWNDFVDNADISSLSAPLTGNPWGYLVESNLIMPVSCPYHYYANHVKNLLADIDIPTVAEIGGGFGGFGYYLLSSGKPYKYINFDLPEVLLIAQYYLMNEFSEKKILLFAETKGNNISLDIIDQYDVILMPNFQLPRLASDSVDLFINTGSLSEMDYHTVEEYISQIVRTCKLYFFHDNSDREVPKGGEHIEVPSSKFPIPRGAFQRIYKSNSLWGTAGGRYREHLYRRLKT